MEKGLKFVHSAMLQSGPRSSPVGLTQQPTWPGQPMPEARGVCVAHAVTVLWSGGAAALQWLDHHLVFIVGTGEARRTFGQGDGDTPMRWGGLRRRGLIGAAAVDDGVRRGGS
jgi:hypothetical protein